MNYKYGFANNHFVIEKKDKTTNLHFYQEYEYLFDKELSNKVATCIFKYIQVANFTYKEKYKRRLKEDYEYLKKIGSE